MRTLVTVMFAAAVTSMFACSSTDPGSGTPAPTSSPDPMPSEQPHVKVEEPPSRIDGVSTSVSTGLAAHQPRPLLQAKSTPSQQISLCGKNICEEGEFCCNASCGICVKPHGTCSQATCDQ